MYLAFLMVGSGSCPWRTILGGAKFQAKKEKISNNKCSFQADLRLHCVERERGLCTIIVFADFPVVILSDQRPDSNVYEGIIRVHLNIYRPIKMSLSSRPSSIYDILVRTDARLPEKESSVAFFRLPSNTFKAIHVTRSVICGDF